MARNRKEPKIPLKHADRSGPDPSQQTLLDIAEQRGLLKDNNGKDEDDIEAASVGRLPEALLWTFSLTTGLFTLDVLVANQYAMEIEWAELLLRTMQAFPIILTLFYLFHPHPNPPALVPRLIPARFQTFLHQLIFFASAISGGSYLIYLTNTFSYYAVLKQAAPIGILWIWSVIELDLPWAVLSLVTCGIFLKAGGYSLT